MASKENLIQLAIATAGLSGVGTALYRDLKRPNSTLREIVIKQFALMYVDYSRFEDIPNGINDYFLQIGGPVRTSNWIADVLTQPNKDWLSRNIFQPSLVSTDLEAIYFQLKPADYKNLPDLFVLREYGEPVTRIKVPLSESYVMVATVRNYLVGRNLVPRRFLPPGGFSPT